MADADGLGGEAGAGLGPVCGLVIKQLKEGKDISLYFLPKDDGGVEADRRCRRCGHELHKHEYDHPVASAADRPAGSSPPGEGKKRPRHASSSDSDSDGGAELALDFALGDPLDTILGHPIDTSQMTRFIASGSKTWVSHPTLIPPKKGELDQTAVKDPERAAWNVALANDILAARELAAVLDLDRGPDGDPVPEAEEAVRSRSCDTDHTVGDLFAGGGSARLSPKALLMSAFIRTVKAIGRRAEILVSQATHHDPDEKVRDARGDQDFTPIHVYVERDRIEDEMAALEEHGYGTSIDDACKDIEFVIGAVMCDFAFAPERPARHLWRAVATLKAARIKAVRKEKAAEIKLAKDAAKEAREGRRLSALATAAASAAAARTRAATPGASASTAFDVDSAAGAGAGGAAAPGRVRAGARSGGGGGPAADGGAARQTRDQILALPPAKRSNTHVRRFGLCGKCREPGHLRAACTAAEVKFAP
jgi:hypothetical protein